MLTGFMKVGLYNDTDIIAIYTYRLIRARPCNNMR